MRVSTFLVHRLPTPGQPAPLSETEIQHARNVLRLSNGTRVRATDGRGGVAWATLQFHGKSQGSLTYDSTPVSSNTEERLSVPLPRLQVACAILKGDAMSWMIEKLTELGIDALQPLITERTVVDIRQKGPSQFQARWQKIADQTLKQCERLHKFDIQLPLELHAWLGKVHPSQSVYYWLQERSITHYLGTSLAALKSQPELLTLLVGPEGGWSPTEISQLQEKTKSQNWLSAHLGPEILRAETAAITGAVITKNHFLTKVLP